VIAVTDAPLRPDRQQARAWAQEELLKREYEAERPGPMRLLVAWLREQLGHVPAPEGLNVNLGVTIAVVLVLALAGYVLWRTGGVHRRARAREGEVFDVPQLTAEEHRRAAQAAEAAGDLRTALLERFRAIARSLSDRALLELSPGRTADELARAAAVRLPGLAEPLAVAARSFDDVRYGGRPATPAAVRSMRELDERAARTTPAANGAAPASSQALL
jgi:hypothetical protein